MTDEITNKEPAQTPRQRRSGELSYKFQRLREKLREAIKTGELSGKLPGERMLADRFHCNAKTLSKALTDLAAEGLLDRSIGRGTYVKGAEPTDVKQGPWLILCSEAQAEGRMVRELIRANPEAKTHTGELSNRPSFVTQFTGVIDFTGQAPEGFLRDLVVRNIPAVIVGHEPRIYSMHSVVIDRTLGAAKLARELLTAGHQRIAACEERGQTAIAEALRQTAQRYAPEAIIDTCFPNDMPAVIEQGVTAVVCDSAETAAQATNAVRRLNMDVPSRLTIAAVGSGADDAPCTGYFVSPSDEAKAIISLLQEAASRRPTTLWLAPEFVDRGTIGPVPTLHGEESSTQAEASSMRMSGTNS